jgi:phosphoribosylamine--glycine ligase
MGDPETEVVIPRIDTDLVALFKAVGGQTLDNEKLEINPKAATTVMLVSGGYPEKYEKGKVISGIDTVTDSQIYHAGTTLKDGQVVSNGGRVLAVTSLDDTYQLALKKSYQNIEKLHFDTMYYRKDIGFDLA